jgi:hypothetical protein
MSARKAGWWLVTLLLAPVAVMAAEVGTASDPGTGGDHKWAFEAAMPMWFFGQTGSVTARGRTADVDVSIKDGLDLMTGGNAWFGAGYFEARYACFGFYVDAFGGYAEDGVSETVTGARGRVSASVDAKANLHMAFVDFAANYRLGQWSLPNRQKLMTLDALVGGRFYFVDARLRASLDVRGPRINVARQAAADETFDWADPLLGVRCEVPLLDAVSFEFRGDIGGFGVGSDLAWGILSWFRYWPSWRPGGTDPWLGVGYRVLDFDREASSQASVDLQVRGPQVGVGLRF